MSETQHEILSEAPMSIPKVNCEEFEGTGNADASPNSVADSTVQGIVNAAEAPISQEFVDFEEISGEDVRAPICDDLASVPPAEDLAEAQTPHLIEKTADLCQLEDNKDTDYAQGNATSLLADSVSSETLADPAAVEEVHDTQNEKPVSHLEKTQEKQERKQEKVKEEPLQPTAKELEDANTAAGAIPSECVADAVPSDNEASSANENENETATDPVSVLVPVTVLQESEKVSPPTPSKRMPSTCSTKESLFQAIQSNDLCAVKTCLSSQRGLLRLNNLDKGELYSPLMLAAIEGSLEVVKTLVEQGRADPDIQNQDGQTALMFAAYKNHPQVALYLIERGASTDLVDKIGQSAHDLAASELLRDIISNPSNLARRRSLLQRVFIDDDSLARSVKQTMDKHAEEIELSVKLKEKERECREKENELTSAKSAIADLEATCVALKKDHEAEVESLHQKLSDVTVRALDADEALRSMHTNLLEQQAANQSLQESSTKANEQLQETQRLLDEQKAANIALQSRIVELENELQLKNESHASQQDENKLLSNRINKLQEALREKNNVSEVSSPLEPTDKGKPIDENTTASLLSMLMEKDIEIETLRAQLEKSPATLVSPSKKDIAPNPRHASPSRVKNVLNASQFSPRERERGRELERDGNARRQSLSSALSPSTATASKPRESVNALRASFVQQGGRRSPSPAAKGVLPDAKTNFTATPHKFVGRPWK